MFEGSPQCSQRACAKTGPQSLFNLAPIATIRNYPGGLGLDGTHDEHIFYNRAFDQDDRGIL